MNGKKVETQNYVLLDDGLCARMVDPLGVSYLKVLSTLNSTDLEKVGYHLREFLCELLREAR